MPRPERILRGIVACIFNDERCEREMKRVLRSRPTKDEAQVAHARLAYWYMSTGRGRLALAHYEAARKLDGWSQDSLFGMLVRAFARFPDQRVAALHPSTLRYDRKHGNIWVRVAINGEPASYLLDTGANLSAVTESWARRLGLHVFDVEPIQALDYADKVTITKLAVAERLDMGGIGLRNVPFLVLTDSGFERHAVPDPAGVVGLQVLLACQTIRWNSDGILRLAQRSAGRRNVRQSNICLDELSIAVSAAFADRQLDFQLDTAATQSHLYPRFADAFPAHVKEAGRQKPWSFAGVGSSVDVQATVLPELTLRFGRAQGTMRPAPIVPSAAGEVRHGLLGMDVFSQAREVTIDFKSMVLTIE